MKLNIILNYIFWGILILINRVDSAVFPTGSACYFNTFTSAKGFKLVYYPYPVSNSALFSQTSFLASGYKSTAAISSANGVTDTSLYFTTSYDFDNYRSVYYGMTIYTNHFVFEYTGFFKRMWPSFC